MKEKSLSLYAKLKTNLYKEITITYYSNPKGWKTENFKLIDVDYLFNLIVSNKKIATELPFFSMTSLIESITIIGENEPIYYNPHIKKHINENFHFESEIIEKIKNDFLANIDNDEIITKRELFFLRYNQKKGFDLNDLFFSEKQKKYFNILFEQLTKELIDYAKNKGLDSSIKPISGGSTSLVYCIGDKILKIGKSRENPTIPYCEYLLQPIINRDFIFDDIPIHIEITERVITYNDLNDQEKTKFKYKMLKLHRRLKSIGLSFSDLHKGNVGILIRDNTIHCDFIPFQTGNDIATSIENNNNLKIRKKGEMVIIDLDYLEIVNLNKYCRYLKKIGYNLEKINDIKKKYGGKVKTR